MTAEKYEASEAASLQQQRRNQHETTALRKMVKWIDAQFIHKTAGLQS